MGRKDERRWVKINRAPVLTLWGAEGRLGPDEIRKMLGKGR